MAQANNRIVVVGGSSGAVDAVRTLAAGLPADFPAPVCVALHTSARSNGLLSGIIGRAGRLSAVTPHNAERLAAGVIYVAPTDRHLLVEPGRARLSRGPKENMFRPAIDPLFRSAAQVYGPGAIGVLLSGRLDDGTAGLWAIKQLGGTAIVQDPDDAAFPAMPESAIRHVEVDFVVRAVNVAPLLADLVHRAVDDRRVL